MLGRRGPGLRLLRRWPSSGSMNQDPAVTPLADELAEPPAGAPYHVLGRTAHYRWWRPLGELVLVMVVTFGAGMLMQLLKDATSSTELGLLLVGAALASLILGTMWAARTAGRRRAGALSSVVGRIRWR